MKCNKLKTTQADRINKELFCWLLNRQAKALLQLFNELGNSSFCRQIQLENMNFN